MTSCSLLSLATAAPPHVVAQAEAKALAREAFARKPLFDRLADVFDNAAIDRRHTVAPASWYGEPHGWSDRNALYLKAAESLFEQGAKAAIDRAGLVPADIDGVVTVSTTGIATPSLEARVGSRLGLRGDVRRVPIFGLGCAVGIGGLATASRLAAGESGSRWLFVTVETCSISIRLDSDDPAAIVATALFDDDAGAAVVGSGGGGLARIAGAGEKLWPDTQRIMGWDIEDPGLAVVFDRAIPPFIEGELAPAVDEMLAGLGRGRGDIDRFCRHPGGVKVIDAIEAALDLPPGELDLERDVLRDFGNMSAPLIVAVHAAWLAALWWLAPGRPVSIPLLAAFAVLQLARLWVIASLGRRWTTRIIVPAQAPLGSAGRTACSTIPIMRSSFWKSQSAAGLRAGPGGRRLHLAQRNRADHPDPRGKPGARPLRSLAPRWRAAYIACSLLDIVKTLGPGRGRSGSERD